MKKNRDCRTSEGTMGAVFLIPREFCFVVHQFQDVEYAWKNIFLYLRLNLMN